MAELAALSPAAGLLPLSHGGLTLEEVDLGPLTLVTAWDAAAASAALEAACGLAFPAPGEAALEDARGVRWFGRAQALVHGVALPEALDGAALVDVSDGWAALRLEGAGAEAVLARLVPVDLREPAFAEGRTARTDLRHMMASVTRVGPAAFEVLVMRSFAATAVLDLGEAMGRVVARQARGA